VTDQVTGHPERVLRLFDGKAATWSGKYAPDGRLTGRLTMLAASVSYHVRAGGRILDLGCGTGDLARYLSGTGFQVTGCDVSARMLTRAAAADPAGRVDWVRLSPCWQALPFSDGAFEAVIVSSVLEYLGSPAAALAECARVVRPGAVVLATVPDLTHPVRWLEGALRLLTSMPGTLAAAAGWPRLHDYLTYLSISRQRHTAAWWSRAGAQAGLETIPVQRHPGERATLRLLAFGLPAGHGAIQ
jgi:SAM-dependent methyltransferase